MRTLKAVLLGFVIIALGIIAFGRWIGAVEFLLLLAVALGAGLLFFHRPTWTVKALIVGAILVVALVSASELIGMGGSDSGSESGTSSP